MRKKIIAGNWKMFLDANSATSLAREVVQRCSNVRDREVVICPAFPLIPYVSKVIEGSPVKLGAQDLSGEEEGAYTGDVSAKMLLSVGCSYVIIGHSERREYHLENDEDIRKKCIKALSSGLIPIVCVGEKLSEREAGKTLSRVDAQVRGAFRGIEADQIKRVVIAYEPVWAIGTGKTATSAQAEEVHEFIRALIATIYDSEVAQEIPILYGGSVKPDNIDELMSQKDIDGALVGGASLKSDSFARIVHFRG